MMQRDTQLVSWFRQSAPYVNTHQGKTFVLMIGGEAIAHPNFHNIVNDIALLNSLGIKLLVVFGARPQIEQALNSHQIDSQYHQNIRVTDSSTFEHIKQITGQLHLELTARLSMGLINTPMQGSRINVVSGNFVTAQPIGVIDGIDYCHSGRVRRIDVDQIRHQLENQSIVLLSPIGFSVTGESFNLSAEELATRLAIEVKADKMIGFCSHEGVLNKQGEIISELLPYEAQLQLEQMEHNGDELDSGTARYLRAAIASCRAGISRSHLISYSQDGALLQELFSREGIGTQIVQESAERSRSAGIDDIPGILELIRPLEDAGVLVRRSREQLETEISQFVVSERDGMILSCAALYPFPDEGMGEIACVATHPSYRQSSRGANMIAQIEKHARRMDLQHIFVLTTHTQHFFRELGFDEVDVSLLPIERQQLYNWQRRSKILMKTL